MTIETDVAALVRSVDRLTETVDVAKAVLDAKVGEAESAETGAAASIGAASGFADAAEASKEQAYTLSQSVGSAIVYQDLAAIAESKGVTAVDVFVYDTSKDSDGGAWRKRTQGTSWYNEALDTATRGKRKEFPAVAVIVGETNKVTIYDGDDPSLPMWMVFDLATSSWASNATFMSATSLLGITMQNAIIVLAGNTSPVVINFITEAQRNYRADVGPLQHKNSGQISLRNTTIGQVQVSGSACTDNMINDVAMTILPNAPIDSATGLPIPTIAVATDGGVSVITDDGSVFDSSTTDAISLVVFDNDTGLYYSRYTTTGILYYSTLADYISGDGFGESVGRTGGSNAFDFNLVTWGRVGLVHTNTDIVLGGSSDAGWAKQGVGLYNIETSDFTKTASALITSDYNTGYMVGDIKLAALSSTDASIVVGSGELVTNGTFDTDTGWTKNAGWTISGGTAVANLVASTVKIQQDFTISAAGYYVISANVATTASTYYFGVLGSTLEHTQSSNVQGLNSITRYLNAGSHTAFIAAWSSGLSGTFDNFSVRLADADRSVNANGLVVHGTIAKTPVATGADLCGYSGFTTINYFTQPYNSDLDFTGDFSVSAWVNVSDYTGVVSHIFERGTQSESTSGLGASSAFRINAGGTLAFNHTPDGYISDQYLTTTSVVPLNTWSLVSVVRDGSTLSLYLNGNVEASLALSSVYDLTNTSGVLRVGKNITSASNYMNGPIANLRISATASSAQRIKDDYDAEKPLYQENAKATLYGTSDAVTALAHDSDTDLLHVGTPEGRSVFQGLQRVSNTTDAVTTVISASNGLLVEE